MLCNYHLGKSLVCVRAEGDARVPRAPPLAMPLGVTCPEKKTFVGGSQTAR